MKKKSQKRKKKGKSRAKRTSSPKKRQEADLVAGPPEKKPVETKRKPARSIPKKAAEVKPGRHGSVLNKGLRFLGEAKAELKKVKWPTRKELLASTAVVIVLTVLIASFLGVVDFGLIKIIKSVIR
ncbi:MAG: preprotein translocase subunit SecE [Deltaproteobacteria bacterium]|nr:preprotein translocase subunit SecE [Deltaproteobacteria bacterium]